jgi:hypothetical protein
MPCRHGFEVVENVNSTKKVGITKMPFKPGQVTNPNGARERSASSIRRSSSLNAEGPDIRLRRKARSEGKYRGRPEDEKRNAAIMKMLKRGTSWNSIIEAASSSGKKLSRATLSKLSRRVREAAA